MAFFGAITANITHELNNVLSIIEQSSGLLEDLSFVAQKGGAIPPEKLLSATEKTTKHTQRGFELIRNLNRFAHSVDEPVKIFNLCDVISNFHALTLRFANLKQVEYHLNIAPESFKVSTDEFELQRIIFLVLRSFLDNVEKGDTLQIGCEEDEGKACVWIQLYSDNLVDAEIVDKITVDKCCNDLSIRSVFEIDDNSIELRLYLEIVAEEEK